ncbi:MAG: metallophosphoesterase [Paracoccus sp. (in: a-proteobacteria)]
MPDGSPLTKTITDQERIRHSTLSLRILATTDLHMNLGTGAGAGGLARLAPLIAAEREYHQNVLLFDNGDLIEGTPLADEIARTGLGLHDTHPAVAALNALAFDAATLGNHDFAHGVTFLRQVLRNASYPVTLANAGLIETPPLWSETILLSRQMHDSEGRPHPVIVGVFGVIPPQTVIWEPDLTHDLHTDDVVASAKRAVSSLRARGVEVIIALSHGGFGKGVPARAENAAGAIAAIPGVNAVIAGHTHETAIHPAYPGHAVIVESGFNGSHLAAVTLELQGCPGHWQITCRNAEILPAAKIPCPRLVATISNIPLVTEERINTPIGRITVPVSSHYALLGADTGLRLIESALRSHIAETMPRNELPVLTACAPFRTGGRGGPEHFITIPPGPFRRADLSALYPFSNHVSAICVDGAEVSEWLERAATLFLQLSGDPGPGALRPQPLINNLMPGFLFDIIAGLEYEIDLSRAPAFDIDGTRLPDGETRIRALRHDGQTVAPTDRFLLISNSYRLSGVPLYAPITAGKTCQLPDYARTRVRDIIARHLTQTTFTDLSDKPFFRLSAPNGAIACFDTAPDANPAACPLPASPAGLTGPGFQHLHIKF